MSARVAEIDPREPKADSSCLFPTTSIAVIPLQSKTSDKPSLSTGQSAPRTGDSSSSSKSANSRHHHVRNNSATVISTAINTSIPRPADNYSAKRSLSSPSTPSYFPYSSTYFNKQSGGLGLDPKSPPSRRQPASRSSHGIETSTGPPPALITQRSYTTDSGWKQPSPLDWSRHSKYRPDTQKIFDSIISSAELNPHDKHGVIASEAISSECQRLEMAGDKTATMATTEKRHRGHVEYRDPTVRNFDPVASSYLDFAANANEKRSGRATINDSDEQTKSSQEDLFLILARSNSSADNAKDVTLKGEQRRVSLDSYCSYYVFAPPFYVRYIRLNIRGFGHSDDDPYKLTYLFTCG